MSTVYPSDIELMEKSIILAMYHSICAWKLINVGPKFIKALFTNESLDDIIACIRGIIMGVLYLQGPKTRSPGNVVELLFLSYVLSCSL